MKIRNRMRIEKNRIEAFSDGVMAIIVTIMMLNIPLPGSYSRESLTAFLFNIAVFFVSFIVVGAQWVKHLQLFTMCRDISEKVLWRNLLHLFFLSLMPLFTKWIMENPGRVLPAIAYDVLFAAVFLTFHLLHNAVLLDNKRVDEFRRRLQNQNLRRHFSWIAFSLFFLFVIAVVAVSFFVPAVSIVFFVALPVISSLFNLWVDWRGGFKKAFFHRKQKLVG